MEECCYDPSCQKCGGSGDWVLADRCPREIIDAQTEELVFECLDARNGAFPVDGGTLNQTQSFMQAYRLVCKLLPKHA